MNPSENKIMALLAQWLCTVMKLYLLIKSINFYLPLKKIVAYQWIRSVMKLYLLVKSTNFYLPLKKIGRFCYFLYVIITWGGSYKVIYCTRLPNGTTWTHTFDWFIYLCNREVQTCQQWHRMRIFIIIIIKYISNVCCSLLLIRSWGTL